MSCERNLTWAEVRFPLTTAGMTDHLIPKIRLGTAASEALLNKTISPIT